MQSTNMLHAFEEFTVNLSAARADYAAEAALTSKFVVLIDDPCLQVD